MRRWLLGAVLATALGAAPSFGQSYFGQNQVQYDTFEWTHLDTEHFQVFYYRSEARAAFGRLLAAGRP